MVKSRVNSDQTTVYNCTGCNTPNHLCLGNANDSKNDNCAGVIADDGCHTMSSHCSSEPSTGSHLSDERVSEPCSYKADNSNFPLVKLCVITTPERLPGQFNGFASPFRDEASLFDPVLEERLWYLPHDYVISVKVYENQYLHVTSRCHTGHCNCMFFLDGIPTKLKPCRFAAIIWFNDMSSEKDLFILEGICRGFRVVDPDTELSYSVDNYSSILKGDTQLQMSKVISEEVRQGQISPIPNPAACSHALGAVKRPDGRIRPITDCSRPALSINDYMLVTAKKFSFTRIEETQRLISPGGFGAVVDISNAYRWVHIFPPHRDFMGFSWSVDGIRRFFNDNMLCFGLKSAPFIFNSLSDFITRAMSCYGIPCLNYLDDFFLAGPSYAACASNQDSLIKMLHQLGFKVNFQKVKRPSHTPKYLGIIVDLIDMCFCLPQDKLARTAKEVNEALATTWCSRKRLERLTGLLAHCATLVRGGRTFCRRLYSLLKVTKKAKRIRLTELYRLDLLWWKSFLKVFNGRTRIISPEEPSHHVFTDASSTGFGAWTDNDYLFGFWGPSAYSCHHVSPPPVYNNVANTNINVQELWPVVAAIKRWGQVWAKSSVMVHTDNTQVLSMILSGRSCNTTAMCLLREMFWCCAIHDIHLYATYISTHDNVFADNLSRLSSRSHANQCYGMPLTFMFCCSH